MNGNREWMSLHNMSREEVYQWTGSMIGSLQRSNVKIKKNWHTDYPSVQGPWCAVGNPPQPKEQEPLSPAVQKLLLLAKENNTKSQ